MARILAISSYVAYGHVGLAAIVPALQAMRHEVIAIPTVVLSSHKGYDTVRGFPLTGEQIDGLIEALAANGWLDDVDAVLTGYMPSAEVAGSVARALAHLGTANPEILYLCDPVLGDDPGGLYVGEDVAVAMRDRLVPLADIVTPNRFELAWLSGLPVDSPADADAASDEIGADLLVATSIPAGERMIANVYSTPEQAGRAEHERFPQVPHGTGDLFAALLLGHMLEGCDAADATSRATAGVRLVIEASLDTDELRLTGNVEAVVNAEQPWIPDV